MLEGPSNILLRLNVISRTSEKGADEQMRHYANDYGKKNKGKTPRRQPVYSLHPLDSPSKMS